MLDIWQIRPKKHVEKHVAYQRHVTNRPLGFSSQAMPFKAWKNRVKRSRDPREAVFEKNTSVCYGLIWLKWHKHTIILVINSGTGKPFPKTMYNGSQHVKMSELASTKKKTSSHNYEPGTSFFETTQITILPNPELDGIFWGDFP